MIRRSLAALFVVAVAVSFVVAGSYEGVITSYSEKEVKITLKGAKKGEKGEEKTFKVGKDIKIEKQIEDDKTETVKADDFTKSVEEATKAKKGPKGVRVKVETKGEKDDEAVTSITIVKGKGK